MPKLLSDKIQEFIDWLADNTDFGEWNINLQIEVQKKLIEIMTQPEKKEHKWQFYFNGTFCQICGCSIGDNRECK